jgi:SprB repeat/Secretion system C-terminal sorting domain
MRAKFFLPFLFLFLFIKNTSAQPANGSIAPNWTMTDLNGTSQTLYDYTNAGKVVVLDFSATWCSFCWNYHNTHAIKDFYNANGPSSGAYTATAFFIKANASGSTGCLYGSGGGGTPFQACTGSSTLGNWVAGTPYPIIDNASQNGPYNISSVPTIVMVCPDKKVYNVGQASKTTLESQMLSKCGVSVGGGAAALSYASSKTNVNCFGAQTGSITLSPAGAIAPYTYAWSNNATTKDLTNLAAGNYTCTITASNGATLVTSPITLTQGTEIKSTPTVTAVQACGQAGNISLATNGGSGTYTYLWNNAATTSSINNITSAGTYSVTISDALACKQAVSNIGIIANTGQPTATIDAPDQITCTKNSVCLKANATAGANINYTWSGTGITGGGATLTPCVNAAGSYTLTVTDNLSACTKTANIAVVANKTAPDSTLAGNNALNCTTPVSAISAVSNPTYTYLWSTVGGTINGANNTLSINAAQSGTYKVSITNTANGCKSSATKIVTADFTIPSLTISKPNDLDCQKTIVKLTATSNATNVNYLWTNGSSESFFNVTSPGTYKLTITNTVNGCTNSKEEVVVANLVQPNLTISKPHDLDCKKAIVKLTATSNATNVSYLWANGSSESFFNVTSPGTYKLTITNTVNGCTKTGDATVLNTNVVPSVGVQKNVNCNTKTAKIVVDAAANTNYTYEWTLNGVVVPALKNQKTATLTQEGDYILTIKDTINGCEKKEILTVIFPTPPTIKMVATDVKCFGTQTGSAFCQLNNGTPPFTYLWNTGSTTSTLSNLGNGLVAVTLTDAVGCIVSSQIQITQPPVLEITSVIPKNATGTNKNGSVVSTVSGGKAPYTYEWFLNGVLVSTSKDLTNIASGFYDLKIKDANECVKEKTKIEVKSTPTKVSDLEDVLKYSISPNPNQGVFSIQMTLKKASLVKFSLYDVAGRMIEEKNTHQEQIKEDFNITSLPNGVYLLYININGNIAAEKIVKE